MSNLRFKALNVIFSRSIHEIKAPSSKISDFFGVNVFDKKKMKDYLSKEAYQSIINSIDLAEPLNREVSEQIASAMKFWAMSKGATHYTHWFQPLTGATAEKHDSFFEPGPDGSAMECFSGSALVQQEPDASSFPSGGIRNTFEARGYTAWDPSSPAFIMESKSGKTLCIPTVFVSYTGEALDYKAPLLKALSALDKAAVDVCHYFDKSIEKVNASLGIEQEYFLVDLALFNARPDLYLTGRTLFGHMSAKGQQLDDHYFGAIPERVFAYMQDFEQEAYKLGIPLRTRHNEVAPSQFECAPIFEEVNIAVDHNSLLMDVMSRVAKRHQLKVLMHEKPFAGVNGSGKHNNWSMATDTGINLLAPGKTPRTNLMFLTFFVNVLKAVHEHADLLRASIASSTNDHRLGANEAPPAIISVFVGKYLTDVLNEVEQRVTGKFTEQDEVILKMDIHKNIPELLLDNTDRNRTSPFAFTGNKFEFRAVGSSANCAWPMTILNTIMADTLIGFKKEVDALIEKGEKKEIAVMHIIRKYITESKDICFEGDNYSEAWANEAAKRGLNNFKDTPRALDVFSTEKTKNLFKNLGIFSHIETEARHEIMLEEYVKKVQIEARLMGYLASNTILPASIQYQNTLIDNVKGLKEIGLKPASYKAQIDIIEEISTHINGVSELVEQMIDERKKANNLDDMHARAVAYCDQVKPYFEKIRYHADKLELIVDDRLWSLPKYREMLFLR